MPIGGIVSGIVNLARDDKGGQGSLDQAARLWKKLQTPDFDVRSLSPPELQQVAEYFPNIYEAIVQQDVSVAEDSPGMRAAQTGALGQWQNIAQEGLPLAERAVADNYQRDMSQAAQRTQMAVLRNMSERGRLGGGTEMVGRMLANQQSSDLARGYGNDLAQLSVQNRLQALNQVGGLGGQIRGQDIGLSTEQARSQNRFNEWVSALKTGAAQYGAGARERSHFANVGTQQGLADENERARYLNEIRNQEYPNQMAQQGFMNDVTKLQGRTGALTERARGEFAIAEARRQAIQGIGAGVDKGGLSILGGF